MSERNQHLSKVKFWNSIVSRFALFFTGLLVFSILLSGYLVYEKAAKVIIAYSQEQIKHASQLAEQSFYSLLSEVSNDIAIIASSSTLKNYVNLPSEKHARDLDQLFKISLKNNEAYFQIGLLAKEMGKELIRFNREHGEIVKVTTNNLQKKGDQDYFQEAIKVKQGEFYFSTINLNEEFGKISLPYTPTLRAASPVYNQQNEIIGLVTINVDLSFLFQNLRRIAGNQSILYLLDETGQYLFSPRKEQQFGKQLKTNSNFRKDFNAAVNTISSTQGDLGAMANKEGNLFLYYVKKLPYFQDQRRLFLMSMVEQNTLLSSARAVRSESAKTLFIVCLASLLLSFLFTRIFSRRINRITRAVSHYAEGNPSDFSLPETRKDEIGILARSFTKMKRKIDQQVKDLNEALYKEQKAIQQRDEFLQNMSHELRTPLNAIIGLTKLLGKNSPQTVQLPIIHSLERSATNLSGLVYDVLDHRKLIEGKVTIVFEPTSLKNLLEGIYKNYQYEAIQKGLLFELDLDPELNEKLYQTDPLRLSQIVINLIVNAIKYTEKGRVTMSAYLTTGDPSWLEIQVIDTGVGIHAENLNKINDRYFQEKNELSGRYGGYGLGLSIVKQLVALFGGVLEAQSEKNKGSRFCIRIPMVTLPMESTSFSTDPDIQMLPTLSKKYHILHIEDDSSTRELIKHILDWDSIKLNQIGTLDEVKKQLKNDTFDLIITDLMLVDQPLHPFVFEWINTEKGKTPLIILSALEPARMSPLSKYFLQKPFLSEDLEDLVCFLLGLQEFTPPDFSALYQSYDEQKEKINKVLYLLEGEFQTYQRRIEKVMHTIDQTEWEAIRHKLIAHINNLKLEALNQLMPTETSGLNKEIIARIQNLMQFYQCCFRVEKKINSRA